MSLRIFLPAVVGVSADALESAMKTVSSDVSQISFHANDKFACTLFSSWNMDREKIEAAMHSLDSTWLLFKTGDDEYWNMWAYQNGKKTAFLWHPYINLDIEEIQEQSGEEVSGYIRDLGCKIPDALHAEIARQEESPDGWRVFFDWQGNEAVAIFKSLGIEFDEQSLRDVFDMSKADADVINSPCGNLEQLLNDVLGANMEFPDDDD